MCICQLGLFYVCRKPQISLDYFFSVPFPLTLKKRYYPQTTTILPPPPQNFSSSAIHNPIDQSSPFYLFWQKFSLIKTSISPRVFFLTSHQEGKEEFIIMFYRLFWRSHGPTSIFFSSISQPLHSPLYPMGWHCVALVNLGQPHQTPYTPQNHKNQT